MLFGTHAKLSDADFGITFKGRPIKRVYEFKYLGVVFDKQISRNSHVKYILSRDGKRLGMLGHIRGNLTSHCADFIYTAYIRPIMDYCDTVWNCCGVATGTSLERLQRRATKTVFKIGDRDEALEYLKWPSLVTRRENDVNKLVKRCIKGQCPQFFKNYFTFNRSVHNRKLRQMNKLHLPRVRIDIAKTYFIIMAVISADYLFFSSLAEWRSGSVLGQ